MIFFNFRIKKIKDFVLFFYKINFINNKKRNLLSKSKIIKNIGFKFS